MWLFTTIKRENCAAAFHNHKWLNTVYWTFLSIAVKEVALNQSGVFRSLFSHICTKAEVDRALKMLIRFFRKTYWSFIKAFFSQKMSNFSATRAPLRAPSLLQPDRDRSNKGPAKSFIHLILRLPFWPLSSHLSPSLLSLRLILISLSVNHRNGLLGSAGRCTGFESELVPQHFNLLLLLPLQPTWQQQPGASPTSWATCRICSCGLATTSWATARRSRPASSPT